MQTAFEKLGLSDSASEQEVKDAWRRLASEHHPDHGGDAEKFKELRKAYQEALAEAASRDGECTECLGTGKIIKVNGFHSITITCTWCGGNGN